jgi:hypothetical protein
MPTVLTSILLGLLAAGCGGDGGAATADGGGATAHCGPVETIPIQGEGHLVGDQDPPVAYSSTPPTSGWHASGDVAFTVYDDPLREPEQVTVLELGGVVISYHDLEDAAVTQLRDLVTGELDGQAALTPYDALEPGKVALTAWGTLQTCDAVDPAAITAFVAAHAEGAG